MDLFKPIITLTRETISVEAPYNVGFISRAGQLGGVFRNKQWVFSHREELDVRKACEQFFGYSGIVEPVKVDVNVLFNKDVVSQHGKSIDILARPIARISPKSSEPLIAPGTLIKDGEILASGKQVIFKSGTRLILRSVPYSLYKSHATLEEYTLGLEDADMQGLEILIFEHDKLIERLAEVKYIISLADKDIEKFSVLVDKNYDSYLDGDVQTVS